MRRSKRRARCKARRKEIENFLRQVSEKLNLIEYEVTDEVFKSIIHSVNDVYYRRLYCTRTDESKR